MGILLLSTVYTDMLTENFCSFYVKLLKESTTIQLLESIFYKWVEKVLNHDIKIYLPTEFFHIKSFIMQTYTTTYIILMNSSFFIFCGRNIRRENLFWYKIMHFLAEIAKPTMSIYNNISSLVWRIISWNFFKAVEV